MSLEGEILARANSRDPAEESNDDIRGLNYLLPGVDLANHMRTLTKEEAKSVSIYFGSTAETAVMNIETIASLMAAYDKSVSEIPVTDLGNLIASFTTRAVAAERLRDFADCRILELNGWKG